MFAAFRLVPKQLSCLLFSVFFLVLGASASAHHMPTLPVEIQNADGSVRSSFEIPLENKAGGVSLAAADLGTDGVPEILVGNGIGNEPRVRVYRQDGSEIGSFLAYAPDMGSGITLDVCDLDGDGLNEIVTGTQRGGGPHVRVFDHMGKAVDQGGFFAYAETYRDGVNLACGDLDGDAAAELVTLPAAGGGPHVRIWKWNKGSAIVWKEFFAFNTDDRRGLVGDVANGTLSLATSHGMPTVVRAYVLAVSEMEMTRETSWRDEGTATGTAQFLSTDAGRLLVIEGSRHVVALDDADHATTTVGALSPRLTIADFDGDGVDERIVAEGRPLYAPSSPDAAPAKSILIDLSTQQLYAYENSILAHTFPISAAKKPWQTPVGMHQVLAKIPSVHYAWYYGSSSPHNYDLGWVPWNLRIYPHVYIHYAYWHNNFGHPMSHGCVNVNLANMKWIYAWANVGTPVEVRT
ncbi:L,D-transpeptidase family protein [Candidatus Uhrbacteria bacterium]|nr:L,D-transpeptidase family protein [Candidatus Uhrbacteria bacterium]